MGLYDHVVIPFKFLPDIPQPLLDELIPEEVEEGTLSFQTKSLDNTLSVYTIDANGLLNWIYGPMTLFNDTINFYTSIGHPNDDDWEWVEYCATFENGVISKCERDFEKSNAIKKIHLNNRPII